MNERHEQHEVGTTRIGPYLWDVDLENMDIEELDTLATACHFFMKRKLKEEYKNKMLQLMKEAAAQGLFFYYDDEPVFPSGIEVEAEDE